MNNKLKKTKIKSLENNDLTLGFIISNRVFLIITGLIVLFPILYTISSSFSESSAVIRGEVKILPVGFNLNAYAQILKSKMLITGYRNSILYAVVGTSVNIILTVMAAYPLSIKDFVGRKFFTGLFIFTMVFQAPLIPVFLTVKSLGLYNTMWALILPNAIIVYNMIIARTYFSSIPQEMHEAAKIDGASDISILLRIILPISKPILAVLVLYYTVIHWNSYFNAFIYLSSESKLTLQVVLRNIMSSAEELSELSSITEAEATKASQTEVMKYAIIVFGSLPVIAIYPFVQKYFIKGVMIGSVKG